MAGLDPEALRSAIDEPSIIDLHRQPIVDLARGRVAGFEVLSRFPFGSPSEVFAEATRLGLGVELEVAVLREALRAGVAPSCFLSINLSPPALADPRLFTVLGDQPLAGVVFEITEHVPVDDYAAVTRAAQELRERGAMIAVDDAGAGYASLRHVLAMRPQFVKVDRSLVENLPADPAKRAVIEMLGRLTSQMDAWLIAEGIETDGELHEVLALGTPLGQGYRLARPGPGFPVPSDDVRQVLLAHPRHHAPDAVDALVSAVPALGALADAAGAFAAHAHMGSLAFVDGQGRTLGLIRRSEVEAGIVRVVEALFVEPGEALSIVARRAAARPLDQRFDALVCRDPQGGYRGLVEVDRLLDALALRVDAR
ncbi:MAG: diguanylate phosphodiesterase [Sandaracinus sp.]|nr:diguanylate phosphodiesterase [Sandaracinus sp.]